MINGILRASAAILVLLTGGCALDPALPAGTGTQAAQDAGLRPDARGGGLLSFKSRLIPTPEEERARLGQELGRELAATLTRVDGVREVRVHLALPGPAPVLAARRQITPPGASVLIKLERKGAVTQGQVKDLVAGAVRGLEPAAVKVVLVLAETPSGVKAPLLVQVGPFSVAPGSRPMLLVSLSVGLMLIITLCGLVVYLLRRAGGPPPARG